MSKLWFDRSARNWTETLPIGNGKLGAMIYGAPGCEHLQLNEDSVWYGGYVDRTNPDAKHNLEKVRALISCGRIKEAEQLMVCAFTGLSPNQSVYQPLGDLFIEFSGFDAKSAHGYRRELSLENAVHTVEYECGGNALRLTSFASFPGNFIAVYIESVNAVPFSLRANLSRGVFYEKSFKASPDTVGLTGSTGSNGVHFCSMVKAVSKTGRVGVIGDRLMVTDSTGVVLLLTAATTFRVDHPRTECASVLDEASKHDIGTLLQTHIEDYQKLYNRVCFHLDMDTRACEAVPVDNQLSALKNLGDNTYTDYLIKCYFDYGRYLMISGSRPGSLPLTLQGIWNEDMTPSWDSKYTININTEMNYWPVEACGLPECHLPLIEHVRQMLERGKQIAESMYGCRGFVAHHNTDLWADCAPEGDYIPGTYWVMGGAWLSLHLWEHFLFAPDSDYLKSVYPVLKEAATFFLDFLTPYGEYLTVCPTLSPENSYFAPDGSKVSICAGATMDYQILRDLFSACIESAKILDTDVEFTAQVKAVMKMLPPERIGKHGQLLEWIDEFEEAEPGHRHISHLYGLFPSNQISTEKTPELARAAKRTLERRLENGGGHTGWSLAWITNLYARLKDSTEAYKNLVRLLSHSTQPNLLDFHPPFQIDGNFGGTSAVVEMLVQSSTDSIVLLPALPAEWRSGSLSGIRIKGGGTIDIAWKNNKLTRATVYPLSSFTRTVHYCGKTGVFDFTSGVPAEIQFDIVSKLRNC